MLSASTDGGLPVPNIYGRCAFEYNPGTGDILLQLPIIRATLNQYEEFNKIENESVDWSRVETDQLGLRYLVELNGSFMSEADKASFVVFEEWAGQGNEFSFYPYYPSNNRPAFYKSKFTTCKVPKDYKLDLSLSEDTAGWYNFNIVFRSPTWED